MSKFKAFEKRSKTLLVEYKNQFKANRFVDKRLGENDTNLTLEDKMFKRFVVERQKHRDRRGSKFNLNDDDDANGDDFEGGGASSQELTHLGQSLSQIEKFENVRLDSDEDDDDDPNSDRGRINAKIVSDQFFGGFGEEDGEDEEKKKKSRKDWIDEMIAKSKQIKYERQKERDKTLDMTEELDKEWAKIRPLISKMSADAKKKEEEAPKAPEVAKKADDFDCLIRSLQFDSKAQATDKTKTPQELEKERQEALKKQEQELAERMRTEFEADEEDQRPKSAKNIKKSANLHISADDIEFDDPEYVEYFRKKDITGKRKLEAAVDAEAEKSKQLSDDEDEDEEEDEEDDQSSGRQLQDGDEWSALLDSAHAKLRKGSIGLKDFQKQFSAILAKLDPSKDEKNKQRLCSLVQSLIEIYKKECLASKELNKEFLNFLIKYIYELTHKYGNRSTRQEPSPFVAVFKSLLNSVNKDFISEKQAERHFPQLDKLLVFKLISIVFPTSDFRHLITTPAMILMARYLGQCSIETCGDLFRGLYLCHLFYEYVYKAKRLVPECLQYLNGVLFLAAVKSADESLKQFEMSSVYETAKKTKLSLKVTTQVNTIDTLKLVSISRNESSEPNDKLKVSLLAYTLDILISFANIYKENLCFRELFSLTFKLIALLPKDLYPENLQIKIEDLKDLIASELKKPREHLKCLNKKPEIGKQFEPKVVSKSKFDPRHHNSVISEKQLNARKYKKEMRSAIKEIRNDNQFLARVQLSEQMEKDAKRKQKVKEIMGSLASQEGEYQKAKRQKS